MDVVGGSTGMNMEIDALSDGFPGRFTKNYVFEPLCEDAAQPSSAPVILFFI